MRRRLASMVAAWALAGCGGSPPATPTTPQAQGEPVAVVVSGAEVDLGDEGDGVTVLRPAAPPASLAVRAEPSLEQARTLYRDLAFYQSLGAVGEAQLVLETDPRSEEDFGALHTALLYRAMNELALGHTDRARASLREAVALRPRREPSEGRVPPDVRDLYDEVRTALRAERPAAVSVTSSPPGAQVWVDGVHAGKTPLTVQSSPADHFVRVEALGHAPRALMVAFGAADASPLHVELPRASLAVVTRQIAEAEQDMLDEMGPGPRAVLRALLQAPLLARLRIDGAWELDVVDLRTGAVRRTSLEPATGPGSLRRIAAAARPPAEGPGPAEPEGSAGPWSSPWLWAAIAAAVVAGGVTATLLLTADPGQRFVVEP